MLTLCLCPSLLANAAAAGAAGRRFFAAFSRGLSCGCGCCPGHGRNGELLLIVVFFYPTLLTPCLCRPTAAVAHTNAVGLRLRVVVAVATLGSTVGEDALVP